MQEVNISLPTRGKSKFANCQVGKQYFFAIGTDFEKGKHDILRSAAAAYAKNKGLKASTSFIKEPMTVIQDGKEVKVEPGLYITFTSVS